MMTKENKSINSIQTDEDKIEDYLIRLEDQYEKIDSSLWIIHSEADHVDNMVISIEKPLIVFRVKLMCVPTQNKTAFFETLLRFNSDRMVHGAYALENDNVVIVDTLQLENLDFNEFQASLDSMMMSIRCDYKELLPYLNQDN